MELSQSGSEVYIPDGLAVDAAQMINFGLDLTPLVEDASFDVAVFVEERIARFSEDVSGRIGRSLL